MNLKTGANKKPNVSTAGLLEAVFGCSPAPGVGDGLVVDGVPVFFAVLAVVDVVALDVVFVAGLLPLEQHRGVRVSDGQGGVRRSRSG